MHDEEKVEQVTPQQTPAFQSAIVELIVNRDGFPRTTTPGLHLGN